MKSYAVICELGERPWAGSFVADRHTNARLSVRRVKAARAGYCLVFLYFAVLSAGVLFFIQNHPAEDQVVPAMELASGG